MCVKFQCVTSGIYKFAKVLFEIFCKYEFTMLIVHTRLHVPCYSLSCHFCSHLRITASNIHMQTKISYTFMKHLPLLALLQMMYIYE